MEREFDSLILVAHQSQVRWAYKLSAELSSAGRPSLILAENGVMPDKDNSCLFRNLCYYQNLFKIDYSLIKQQTYDLFHSLSDKEIMPGLTFRGLVTYKGISLWELSAQYVFSMLMPGVYYLNIMQYILDFEKPQDIFIIENNNNVFTRISVLVCQNRHLNINKAKKIEMVVRARSVFKKTIQFLKIIKRTIVSFNFLLLNTAKAFKLQKTYKLIFFVPIERFFVSMLPVMLKYNDNERLVINTCFPKPAKKMKEYNIFHLDSVGFQIYGYFTKEARRILKRTRAAFCNKSEPFAGILHKGVPVWGLLSGFWDELICDVIPQKIREIDIVTKIILGYKPKAIVTVDRSFEIALISKSLSVPIVALQSGYAGEFIFYGPSVVDALLVEGNYWKEYLVQRNVSQDKIHIVGALEFDNLFNSLRQENKYSINSLHNSKKIMVFATTYATLNIGLFEYENLEHIKIVLRAAKNIKGVHLIIKLHPFEKDARIYEKIAKEIGLTDYTIVHNQDLLELLSNSDLLVTHGSKASYEAILLDRDVVLSCYSSDYCPDDIWNFKKYGVAVTVENLNDLERHMRSALFDPALASCLRKRRKEYISEHAYRIDGNAAGRAKKVIDRFCCIDKV